MKIIRLECWKESYQLREPYTIAYEKIESTSNVFLKIDTDQGFSGWGCAAPDPEITGEDYKTVLQAYHEVIAPYLKGKSPFTYALILEELRVMLKNQPSALAMVDMALFDLIGKKTGEPVYRLLGGFRHSIPTSVTIGILSVEETVKKGQEFIDQGFFILKVKGGKSVEEDVERIIRLRETLGSSIEIRFDANQGYSVSEAVSFIEKTKNQRIELLEQPTQRDNPDLLKQVSKRVAVPVMADESLMSLKDVFQLTSDEATDMINIKLMKTGGITEALRINAVAKAAGVESMVGCMDESAMGIAAGLHFALARPNIHYADLDGHFDLEDDTFAEMVICKDGILYPLEKPGFGWSE